MLTDTRVRTIKAGKKTNKLTDGRGLYLEVTPSGGKLWRYRYRLEGKENIFAIGEYPAIGLAEARTARDAARALVKQGINPTQQRNIDKSHRQKENANTFKIVANQWIESRARSWTAEYASKARASLEKDVFPKLGDLPIKSITSPAIMAVLKKIEARGAATQALFARQLVSSTFRHAIINGLADNDPAFPLRDVIARRQVEHHKHLERRDLPAFLRALEDYTGQMQTVIALKLALLTAVRPGELCGAAWAEFDLEANEWRIPKERMKMRALHIVSLSRQAVELINQLRPLTEDEKFLFHSQSTKGGAIPVATLRNAIRRMGYQDKVSPHGFRGTFSTILNERGYKPDIIERQLAHTEQNKVRAAYHHAEYLSERKTMLQDWADMLDAMKVGAQIIPLHGKVA
jgi:integrase